MTSFSGWHVKQSILDDLFVGNPVPHDQRTLERKLCNLDIRDFGDPCLSDCMDKEKLTGPVVLQLSRYRNVSQSKLKEGSNGSGDVGKVSLTDGHTSVSALLLDNLKGLNADTPPGTKLLVSGVVNVENGFLILNSSNVTVIGGRVEKLIDRWMIEQHSIGESQRAITSDHKPPKWISFGKQGVETFDTSTSGFRANDVLKTLNEKNTNDEGSFNQQRKENIRAVEKESTKVFISPKVKAELKPQKLNVTKNAKSASSGRAFDCHYKKKSRRHDDEEVSGTRIRSYKPTLFDFMDASAAPGIADDYHAPSCASPNNAGFITREGKHSHRQQDHARFDGQGVARRSLIEERPNYGHKKEKKADSEGALKNFVMDRVSRQGSRSGRKDNEANNVQLNRRKKVQDIPDNVQNSFQPEISKRMSYNSVCDRLQAETSCSFNSYSNKSQLNLARNGDVIKERVIQSFSGISIDNSLPSASKKLHSSKLCKGGNMQNVPTWKVGDQCQAPWSDGMYYLATIINIGSSGMCDVRYNDYGNTCTVPQGVLLFDRPHQ